MTKTHMIILTLVVSACFGLFIDYKLTQHEIWKLETKKQSIVEEFTQQIQIEKLQIAKDANHSLARIADALESLDNKFHRLEHDDYVK